MVELSAINVAGGDLFGNEVATRFKAWREILEEILQKIVHETNYDNSTAENESYELVEEHNMVGLSIFLFTKRRLRQTYIINNEKYSNSHKLCDYRRQIISDVRKGIVVRGVGGLLGNKGATVIRFRLYDTSVCIVNAHLAHGRASKNLKARNADHSSIMHEKCLIHTVISSKKYIDDHFSVGLPSQLLGCKHDSEQVHHKIVKMSRTNVSINIPLIGTVSLPLQHNSSSSSLSQPYDKKDNFFSSDDDSDSDNDASYEVSNINEFLIESEPEVTGSTPLHDDTVLSPNEHDIVFFMGDLNYRISQKVTLEDAYNLIDAHTDEINDDSSIPSTLESLFEHDQLHQELLKQRGSFRDFQEGRISFTPTYKYIPGTHEYDRRPEKKMRCPAWCDRVLWKKKKHVENLTLHEYDCIQSGIISDHKAVAAKFTITAKQIDWEKRDTTLEQALDSYTHPEMTRVSSVNPYPLYQLDSIKNSIKVEPSFLSISIGSATSSIITITNKYHTPVHISYVKDSFKSASWITFSALDTEVGAVLENNSKLSIIININDEAENALAIASNYNNYTNPALLPLKKFVNTEINTMLFLRVFDAMNPDAAIDIMVPITLRQ